MNAIRRGTRRSARRLLANRQAMHNAGVVGILRGHGRKEATGNRATFSSLRNGPVQVARRVIPNEENKFKSFLYQAPQPVASILNANRGPNGDDGRIRKGRFARGDNLVDIKMIPGRDGTLPPALGSFRWVDQNKIERRCSSRLLAKRN